MEETTAGGLALVDTTGGGLRLMERDPEQVLADAARAAQAIARVLESKERKVEINGKQYLEFEDWQTLGHFYGYTAGAEGEPEFVQYARSDGSIASGFRACGVVYHRGQIITRAYALCMDDEEDWSTRTVQRLAYVCKTPNADGTKRLSLEDPGYDELTWEPNPNKPGGKRPKKERMSVEERVTYHAIMSMAQTRAAAKALRQVLSWNAVLNKSLAATPAEEMMSVQDGEELHRAPSGAKPSYVEEDDRAPWQPSPEQGKAMVAAIRKAGGKYKEEGGKRFVVIPDDVAVQVDMPTSFDLNTVKDAYTWQAVYQALHDHTGKGAA